jgi:hypothetical protein
MSMPVPNEALPNAAGGGVEPRPGEVAGGALSNASLNIDGSQFFFAPAELRLCGGEVGAVD